MAKHRRVVLPSKSKSHQKITKIVDGAVYSAFACHPEYLTERGLMNDNARRSIVKRVAGLITAFAEQSAQNRP